VKKIFFEAQNPLIDIKNINWLRYVIEKPLKESGKLFFISDFLKKLCKNKNINFYYDC